MRHTITEGPNAGKRINVPDDFIERTMRAYEVDRKEAVRMYLSDEGYDVNPIVEDLTAKAHDAGTTAKNTADKPKRKPPVRKPDPVKRAMISGLYEYVASEDGVEGASVDNPERVISFSFAGDKYELTLTKKRKPKE